MAIPSSTATTVRQVGHRTQTKEKMTQILTWRLHADLVLLAKTNAVFPIHSRRQGTLSRIVEGALPARVTTRLKSRILQQVMQRMRLMRSARAHPNATEVRTTTATSDPASTSSVKPEEKGGREKEKQRREYMLQLQARRRRKRAR